MTRPGRSRALRGAGGILLAILLLAGGYGLFLYHRPRPDSRTESLRAGVTYRLESRAEPPVVIHEVSIVLDEARPRFVVTPPDQTGQLRAMTTSDFARLVSADIAINGDFFEPWWSNGPWDYYPHDGDPVDVHGFAASGGRVYAEGDASPATLYVDCQGNPHIDRPSSICEAISGQWLLRDGEEFGTRSERVRHPRSAICLDETRTTLSLFVVDGRQGDYSDGLRREELAPWLRERGCHDAINLDGGGSSTLVIDGEVVNAPIHTRIVGRERPVANHLGILLPPPAAPTP